MIFSTLPTREATFRSKVSSLLRPFKVPVKGENLTLEGVFYKPTGDNKYFFSTEFPKERILLHFTAGSISSDIDTLTQENGNFISVPFVIARDGTIYQLFGSANWARSIGAGLGNQVGMNNAQDKIVIPIEISNFGFLTEKNGNLETIYSTPDKPQIYCSLADTAAYQKIDVPFREQSYYATFTDQQYESIIILLRFLTAKYNIPRTFLAEDKRYLQTSDVLTFRGIVTHVNYRQGKWDIGNAFDWNRLISGVQMAEFTPQFVANTRNFGDIITSEEDLMKLLPVNPEPQKDEEVVKDLQDNVAEIANKPKKLFALLVGINAYEKFPLSGCVNDVKNIKNYLKTKTGLEANILTLTDKKATKEAVVEAFRTHLSKATKDDTVLFYYSGHGTQEIADPIWKKEETDEGLECIVCYNGKPNFLMADKELRYLIRELSAKTEAHIVTIFDCCHSADNTRGELIKEAFRKQSVKERRIKEAFPQRAWEDFIFGKTISYDDAKTKNLISDFLPEGNHVQLAACESDESALEVAGNGVFTTTLLKVLENCGGNVSYQALQGRVRNYMKALYEQKPRIYSKGSKDQINTIFLNKGIDENSTYGEVIFNQKQGWTLNLGAVHGIESGSEIVVIDDKNSKIHYKGIAKNIFIDYSSIVIENASLDKKKAYKAVALGALVHELNLELKNTDTNPTDLLKLIDALQQQSGGHYDFKENLPIDYTLHFTHGRAYLTKYNDDFRPLFFPLEIKSEDFDTTLSGYLRDISRWHYVADLKNKNSTGLLKNPLLIEIFKVKQDNFVEKIELLDNLATLNFEKIGDKWKGNIKVKIKNQSGQNLYVCAAYMTTEFEIDTSFLPQKVQLLEPDAEIFLQFNNSDIIPSFLSKVVKEYNWEKSIEFLNFISSTEEFGDGAFVQGALPRPAILSDKDKTRAIAKRKSLGEEEDEAVKLSDWTTQKLILESMNPVYNVANVTDIEAMLAFEDMTDFILGLYYDLTKNEQLQPILQLKRHLILPPDERNLLWDLKLGIANIIERTRRKWAYEAVKNERMRIVAEGDSWFQYPFYVKEIIDQLTPLYAIRSLAAAGDTLENYMKNKEYLGAIAEENPKLFLISGGGNDILGEQFRNFIKQSNQVGQPPEAYLEQAFFDKLDLLEKLYRVMFAEVNIPTIVHGYDYIFPVDIEATPGKASWAGKYMHDQGIINPDDRQKIMNFIMDKFNEKLIKIVGNFPHVRYINLRNTVTDKNNWYDEIHPNDVGFNAIAIKFTEEINKLIDSGVIVG